MPPTSVLAPTFLIAASTASDSFFSALLRMHLADCGSDFDWSTSTPSPMTPGVAQAASIEPAPDSPATWKITSAFWPIICWAIDLPVPGSLNALVMSVET